MESLCSFFKRVIELTAFKSAITLILGNLRLSRHLKKPAFLIIALILHVNLQAQTRLMSWNLKDFGSSKTDEDISAIAEIIKPYDIIAIQEVVAGPGGAKAVARLHEALNRKGTKWDYEISPVTSGSSAHKAERYAFFWQASKVNRVGKGWMEKKYGDLIEREPFYARFSVKGKKITLINFHAITKSQQPETEIKYFKFFPMEYPGEALVFCGDFNVPQSHSVFNPIKKMGYISALIGQKTSLRQRCIADDCLASEFDNFYFDGKKLKLLSAGIIHFYRHFANISDARKISDHVPIFSTIE